MTKYTKMLRWLSLLPVAFTIFVLSDWIVRFALWFMRFPIIIFEKIFGVGSGPIGKIMDSVTNFLVGLGSIETLSVVATGLLMGSALIYLLSILAPTQSKFVAKTFSIILFTLLGFGLVAFFVNGATGEKILWIVVIAIGILMGWHSVKNESEKESEKHEILVQKNIKRIFISTLVFTLLLGYFFFA